MTTPQAKIIDGKALAEQVLLTIKERIDETKHHPGLAAIIVGNDPASLLYVRNKKRAAQKVGIDFHEYRCEQQTTPVKIIEMIQWLNADNAIDGIIVQLPLPATLPTQKIIEAIAPHKDVDGFHPLHHAADTSDSLQITSPLINAIRVALESTGEILKDKTAVVVSKSPVFSKPLVAALAEYGIIAHEVTPDNNLGNHTRNADILVSVVGKKHYITADLIKPHAILIDVGTTMSADGTWHGDIDPAASTIADWITPVPGGIGPLTVAMLIKNTYELSCRNQ